MSVHRLQRLARLYRVPIADMVLTTSGRHHQRSMIP
jgi:hypothetical protein